MNTYRFFDTSSLLVLANKGFKENESFIISSITLNELENIKSSSTKDEYTKLLARKTLQYLDSNDRIEIHIYTNDMLSLVDKNLDITNDLKILSCALHYDRYIHPDETIFVSNDLSQKTIANLYFGEDSIESISEEPDNYTGYKEIQGTEQINKTILQQNKDKKFLENEYLLTKNDTEISVLKWNNGEFKNIQHPNINTEIFGKIKPMKGDYYQQMALDSLASNKITMLKGPAGSGKSLLSLAYLFSLLEHGKINKIIIFCNTVATKNSAHLGFYPGTKDEKLLDSQIGQVLISKLGSRFTVEKMIEDETLILIPFSDLRGYDTSGMRAGIYITEAQNLDITLMKLALQRVSEDSICILDGDNKTQVDDNNYSGINNGMRRVSEIFRGCPFYGEVELKNIYRSEIAKRAELM